MRCGWIRGDAHRDQPDSETETITGQWRQHQTWRGLRGTAIGGRLGPAYCPGYTVRLPEVQEIARFWAWEKRRIIELHVRERGLMLTPNFLDLTDIFAGEAAQAQAWETEQRIERARKDHGNR